LNSIFVQGSGEERNVAELFQKFKDNEKIFDHIFDRKDKSLINKCLKELKTNLDEQEIIKDPAKEKTKEYLHVLKITRERFSNYFHFYDLEDLMILNQLIEKFEDDLK
jgi:6-pyruvoyl-tetrahydropterin synthase